MPTNCSRLSSPSLVKSGASSWHGTHHEAQTLTTLTLPLNTAGSSPGTCVPLLTRPSSAGSAVCGAGRPDNAGRVELEQAFFLAAVIDRDREDQDQHHGGYQCVGCQDEGCVGTQRHR